MPAISSDIIIFETSAKEEILSYFDKKIDDLGYIVEVENPNQKVLTPDGEEINLQEFAGLRKGSEIFIKSNLPSLIEFSDLIK